ncbi:hypothetical protein NE235_06620 [Actinoallomurus spadix]|uniref:hypothetical protein n=1 Tax=Actinoallomurus spadix TaxID=79912 RepID=UPI002093BC81|nr:hypothetical protein [Actinoallomurus spadix]MCO5985779.1 hypothetical protein [Actinoallomurus spadix]
MSGREPWGSGEETVRFDEPWRLEAPARTSRRVPLRPILIATGAVVVAGGLVAGGFFLLSDDKTPADHAGPPALLAGSVFTADPTAAADGRDQALTAVTAVGPTVVAIGGEGDGVSYRPEFLVSTDGGRSFRLADVHALNGEEPPNGDAPKMIAATNGAWIALGDRPDGTAVWTSRDGRSWIRQPDAAGAAFGHNDRIARVSAVGSGFVAVGSTSAKGDFSDPTPVVWRSSDGKRWDRVTGGRLSLPGAGAKMSLVGAAATGNTLITHGIGSTGGKRPKPIDGLWRSADGGRTWAQVSVPSAPGGGGFGIAAIPSGFLIAREAKDKSGRFAAVYSSADAARWTSAGEIRVPGYARLLRFTGSPQGVAALAAAGRKAALVHSADGRSWQSSGDVPLPTGRVPAEVTQTPGVTVLVGRDNTGSDADAMMVVRDTQGQDVQVPAIAGGTQPDRTVNAIAPANGHLVAVGSTNGDAAEWLSADGRTWQRARTVSREGRQRLTAVASGNAGLLAVGFDGTAPRRPLVLTSRDGTNWQSADGAGVFKPSGKAALTTSAAAMGPAGYVVVGEDGFSAVTWFSADLKSWQRGKAPEKKALEGTRNTGRWMRDVAAGPFGYVAVGGLNDPGTHSDRPGRPAAWTSADGRTWTLRQLPLPAGTVEAWFDHVAAKGSVLVATGTATAPSGPQAFAFLSADGGRTWQQTPLTDATTNTAVTATAATPRGFVIAGTAGRPGATDVMLWSSGDGRTWTSARPKGTGLSGKGDQKLNGLTAVGSDLLGLGATSDHTGGQPTLWRRPLP